MFQIRMRRKWGIDPMHVLLFFYALIYNKKNVSYYNLYWESMDVNYNSNQQIVVKLTYCERITLWKKRR